MAQQQQQQQPHPHQQHLQRSPQQHSLLAATRTLASMKLSALSLHRHQRLVPRRRRPGRRSASASRSTARGREPGASRLEQTARPTPQASTPPLRPLYRTPSTSSPPQKTASPLRHRSPRHQPPHPLLDVSGCCVGPAAKMPGRLGHLLRLAAVALVAHHQCAAPTTTINHAASSTKGSIWGSVSMELTSCRSCSSSSSEMAAKAEAEGDELSCPCP